MLRAIGYLSVIGAVLGMGGFAAYLFKPDSTEAVAAQPGDPPEGDDQSGNNGEDSSPDAETDPGAITPPGSDGLPSGKLTIRAQRDGDADGVRSPAAGGYSQAASSGSSTYTKPSAGAYDASQTASGIGGPYQAQVLPAAQSSREIQSSATGVRASLGDDDNPASSPTGYVPQSQAPGAALAGGAATRSISSNDAGGADQNSAAGQYAAGAYGAGAAGATAAVVDAAQNAADLGTGQTNSLAGQTGALSPVDNSAAQTGGGNALRSAATQAAPAASSNGDSYATGSYANGSYATGSDAGQSYGSSAIAAPPATQTAPRQYPQSTQNALDPRAAYASEPRAAYASEPRAAYGSEPRAAYGSALTSQSALPGAAAATLGAAAQGSGAPGAKHLEGPQSPSLTIEKTAPSEIQVDQPATFHIAVRNVGNVAAHDVVVTDQVPQGTSLIEAVPRPESAGPLVWRLGTIEPGEEQTIAVQLMPQLEGEIGSVAQVTFQAHSSVRTVCTKPQLEVTQAAPPQVLIGDDMTVSITITNTGSGAATGVVLESDIPEQFVHAAGNQLEYEIGTLRPGETRQIPLVLSADKAGGAVNEIMLRADGNRTVRHRLNMTVVAPELQVAMDGPRVRYLERQATYTVSVANTGTAPANNVDLVAQLPKGMKFVNSDNQGQYDAQRHAVYWSLEQLPAQTRGDVQLVAVPIEIGEQRIRAEARADLGLAVSGETTLQVDGLAALLYTVVDTADPIEVGSETTYEIRVTNTGTKPDTNILVRAQLPPGLVPVGGDGPTQWAVREQQILFEPLPRLAPNDEMIFKVHAKSASAGNQRISVEIQSDAVTEPVTKEEGTVVYADQ